MCAPVRFRLRFMDVKKEWKCQTLVVVMKIKCWGEEQDWVLGIIDTGGYWSGGASVRNEMITEKQQRG
ncbi:hypothetical protein EYF80_012606 [Liparis tanakae]|uniref:Uncharacterized protein n=1 Tax=Liparis tanakae TaxID=230148 RepID=A0A4Z2IH58_9TELE|nr:hypothetical protein EYF80_012606 [Liparis tanakae]